MRWIIRGIIILIALGLLGAGILFSLPTDRIAARAIDRLEAATGRTVEIRGGIRPRLVPTLGIRAEDIVIGNPDWAEEGPMLAARALNVGVAWAPLFRGEVHLDAATLDAPHIVLVRDADGRTSWSGPATTESVGVDLSEDASAGPSPDAAPEAGRAVQRFGFDQAQIVDGAVLLVDREADRLMRLENISMTLSMPDPDGEARAEFSMDTPDGEVSGAARIGAVGDFLAGEVSDAELGLDWPGGRAEFSGRAGLAPVAEGDLTVDAQDFGPLTRLIGVAAPVLPDGLGRDSIELAGSVTLASEGSLHLRGMEVTLDGNRFQTELDLVPGDARPLLRGNVTAGAVTIPLEGGDTGGAGGDAAASGSGAPAAAAGWSTDPIDASALFLLDTEVALTADAITVGDTALSLLAARVSSENGRMVLDVTNSQIFGGTLSGTFVANGRGTFSARADAELTDIALNPAVTTLTGYDRLEGRGSGRVSVLGQGASPAALIADLDGDGAIELGQGAILGLDIGGMIRNFDAGFRGEGQRTVYDAVTATFSILDGVVMNDDLALTAPWGGITGQGNVDLGGRSVDYLVVPGVMRGEDGGNRVAVPVRIRGPWDDLRYTPDLEALANTQFSEEIDALEARAAEELRDLAREELGVEIEEGASRDEAIDQLEDAIGDRLREELSEGLLRLFE